MFEHVVRFIEYHCVIGITFEAKKNFEREANIR